MEGSKEDRLLYSSGVDAGGYHGSSAREGRIIKKSGEKASLRKEIEICKKRVSAKISILKQLEQIENRCREKLSAKKTLPHGWSVSLKRKFETQLQRAEKNLDLARQKYHKEVIKNEDVRDLVMGQERLFELLEDDLNAHRKVFEDLDLKWDKMKGVKERITEERKVIQSEILKVKESLAWEADVIQLYKLAQTTSMPLMKLRIMKKYVDFRLQSIESGYGHPTISFTKYLSDYLQRNSLPRIEDKGKNINNNKNNKSADKTQTENIKSKEKINDVVNEKKSIKLEIAKTKGEPKQSEDRGVRCDENKTEGPKVFMTEIEIDEAEETRNEEEIANDDQNIVEEKQNESQYEEETTDKHMVKMNDTNLKVQSKIEEVKEDDSEIGLSEKNNKDELISLYRNMHFLLNNESLSHLEEDFEEKEPHELLTLITITALRLQNQ